MKLPEPLEDAKEYILSLLGLAIVVGGFFLFMRFLAWLQP
jgi:hypothetical protein